MNDRLSWPMHRTGCVRIDVMLAKVLAAWAPQDEQPYSPACFDAHIMMEDSQIKRGNIG